MIHGINHVAISTADIDNLVEFYQKHLGFEEVFKLDWEVGEKVLDDITGLKDSSARIVMLQCAPTNLSIP